MILKKGSKVNDHKDHKHTHSLFSKKKPNDFMQKWAGANDSGTATRKETKYSSPINQSYFDRRNEKKRYQYK